LGNTYKSFRPEVAGVAMGLINALGNLRFLWTIFSRIHKQYIRIYGFVVLAMFLLVTSVTCVVLKNTNVSSEKNLSA